MSFGSVGRFEVALDPRSRSLEHVSPDLGVAGLPRLQIQIDLHARLLFSESFRDLDEQSPLVLEVGLAMCSPKELEEVLASIWMHLNPHRPPIASLWAIS